MLGGLDGRLDEPREFERSQHLLGVDLGGAPGHAEVLSNVFVAPAPRDPQQDLPLARRQGDAPERPVRCAPDVLATQAQRIGMGGRCRGEDGAAAACVPHRVDPQGVLEILHAVAVGASAQGR